MRMARLLAVAKADEKYCGPTHWLYIRTGTFLVPVTGDYLIEMHGSIQMVMCAEECPKRHLWI